MPKMLWLEVFCTQLDDGNDGYDDDRSGSDDNVHKGDDFCQFNDHLGNKAMKHAVLLHFNWNSN